MKRIFLLITAFLFSTMIFSQVINKPELLCEGYKGSFSPDGKYFLFTRNTNVWILNLETKEEKKISTLGGVETPRWSPDGKSIVFAGYDSSKMSYRLSIWVVDINGSNQHQIYPRAEGSDDWYPFWSPDGKKIAWTHVKRLWIADSDGKNAKPLTKHPAHIFEYILNWSKDSKTILYRRHDSDKGLGFGDYQICLVNTNSKNQKRIKLLKDVSCAKYGEDDKSIYFTKSDNYISKYDFATKKILGNIILIDFNVFIYSFEISPDFKSFAFNARDENPYFYIMKIK